MLKMAFKTISLFTAFLLFTAVIVTMAACQRGEEIAPQDVKEKIEDSGDRSPNTSTYQRSETPTDYVCIKMDSGAEIVLELLPDYAPVTVENFKKLVAAKFYDGLIFHRVIDGFMIQGGDPDGTGMGGAEEKIKGEFQSNGVANDLKHERGVVSMARSQDPNSASSQFFICQKDSFFLDGDYAAFARVLEGMDEVDRIAKLPKNAQDRPDSPPVMEEVYFINREG